MSMKDSVKRMYGIGSLKMYPPPAHSGHLRQRRTVIVGRVSPNAPPYVGIGFCPPLEGASEARGEEKDIMSHDVFAALWRV
jgi:hypothetical protein